MIRNRLLIIGASVAALALLFLCGKAAVAALGGNGPLATLPSPATMTGCVTVRPASPNLNHAPVVVLDTCGQGVQRTPTFITGDEWAVAYRFDCPNVSGSGVFQANAYSASGTQVGTLQSTLANEAAPPGWGIVPVHATPGAHYISISTACTWTLKVTSYS